MSERRIGGTDISAILGINPYRAPIDAYRRIVEGYSPPMNDAMKRGLRLEGAVREFYVEETGAQLEPHPGVVLSKRHPFMAASVDDLVKTDKVTEYKTATFRSLGEFGEAGTDQVPRHYLTQCAWYLAATDRSVCDLAVLISGDEFRVYRIERDLELENMLVEAGARFWRDHVVPRRPPEVDGSEGYREWLAERYPEPNATHLIADSEAEGLARELEAARYFKDEAEAKEAYARNRLIEKIGNAAGIRGQGWSISYSTVNPKPKPDWEAIARALGATQRDIEQHTKQAKSYRRFAPVFGKKAS